MNAQPFQNVLLDYVLAQHIAEMDNIVLSDATNAMKSIALVGMLLPDDEYTQSGMVLPDRLWSDDIAMLKRSVRVLSDAGIPVHTEPEFSIYNLLPPVQSDFLMSAHPVPEMRADFPDADLVVVAYIPRMGAGPFDRFYNTKSGFKDLKAKDMCEIEGADKLISVSRLHRERDIWAEASFSLGAKFIVTHGGTQDEITTVDMEDHKNSVILACSRANEQKKIYSHQNTGVIANRNIVAEYAADANPENEIGAALIRAAE